MPDGYDGPRFPEGGEKFSIENADGTWLVVSTDRPVREVLSDHPECPVCGKIGFLWGGWFSCEYATHLAFFPTGQAMVQVCKEKPDA